MTATTIALALAVAVLVILDVIRAHRSLPLFGPAHRELNEQQPADQHPELNGAGLPAGMIDHFHNRLILTNREQDHG